MAKLAAAELEKLSERVCGKSFVFNLKSYLGCYVHTLCSHYFGKKAKGKHVPPKVFLIKLQRQLQILANLNLQFRDREPRLQDGFTFVFNK